MNIGTKLKTLITIAITSIVISTSVVNATMYLPSGLEKMLSNQIVFYEGVNIALVNSVPTPIDDNNEDISPFIYTDPLNKDIKIFYVPLKFIANLKGAEVIEDGNKYTIKYNETSVDIVVGSDILTVRKEDNEYERRTTNG